MTVVSTHARSIDNPVRKFRDKRIWAEEGHVIIVDDRTGEFSADPPHIAEAKARQAMHQADNMRRGEFGNYQDERREMTKLANDLKECAKLAREMGFPVDVGMAMTRICTREKQEMRQRKLAAKPLLFIPPGV